MTIDLITVQPDTGVREIARLLIERGVSAVPVVDADQNILGIVSRANLLRSLAAADCAVTSASSDSTVREALVTILSNEVGLDTALINVVVEDGAVALWGLVASDTEKSAAQIAAATTAEVRPVENQLG